MKVSKAQGAYLIPYADDAERQLRGDGPEGVELGRTEKMDKGKLLKKTVITAFVHFLCALVFCKKTGLFKIMGRS